MMLVAVPADAGLGAEAAAGGSHRSTASERQTVAAVCAPPDVRPKQPQPPSAAALPSEWGLRMLEQPAPARRRGEELPKGPVVTSPEQQFPAACSGLATAECSASAKQGSKNAPGPAPQPVRDGAEGGAADDLDALLDRLQLASGRSAVEAGRRNVTSGDSRLTGWWL